MNAISKRFWLQFEVYVTGVAIELNAFLTQGRRNHSSGMSEILRGIGLSTNVVNIIFPIRDWNRMN